MSNDRVTLFGEFLFEVSLKQKDLINYASRAGDEAPIHQYAPSSQHGLQHPLDIVLVISFIFPAHVEVSLYIMQHFETQCNAVWQEDFITVVKMEGRINSPSL